jgi:hypothetical protein
MAEAIDPKLLDKRVAQRYLRKGRLDEKDFQKHLQSLPDLADQALEIDSTFEPSAAPQAQGTTRVEPGIDASEE